MTHSTAQWTERLTRLVLITAVGVAMAACAPMRDGARQVEEDEPSVTYRYSDNEGLVDASFQAETYCRQFNAWPEVEEVTQSRRTRGEVTFTCNRAEGRDAPGTRTLPRDSALSYDYRDQQSLIEATIEAQRHCARYGAEARSVIDGIDDQRRTVAFECVRLP